MNNGLIFRPNDPSKTRDVKNMEGESGIVVPGPSPFSNVDSAVPGEAGSAAAAGVAAFLRLRAAAEMVAEAELVPGKVSLADDPRGRRGRAQVGVVGGRRGDARDRRPRSSEGAVRHTEG